MQLWKKLLQFYLDNNFICRDVNLLLVEKDSWRMRRGHPIF